MISLLMKNRESESIHLRGQDYYQKLLDTYLSIPISLASIDLNERLESLQAQKAKAEKKPANSLKN